jgi:hypothetical protein
MRGMGRLRGTRTRGRPGCVREVVKRFFFEPLGMRQSIASTIEPEVGAECGNSARSDLCGGRPAKGRPYRDLAIRRPPL